MKVIFRTPGAPIEEWAWGEVSDLNTVSAGEGMEVSDDPDDIAAHDAYLASETERIHNLWNVQYPAEQAILDAEEAALKASAAAKLALLGLSVAEVEAVLGIKLHSDNGGGND